MALGALVGAYQEDESGRLRALAPLAGQTLVEYQLRCLASVGAAPLVVLVERIPAALQAAFERLRAEGITVTPVSDSGDAASRFEAGSQLLVLADGIIPDIADLDALADPDAPGAMVVTVPDEPANERFERIDAQRRWAGLARLDAGIVGSTAAIVGDWDLISTLLRRAVQQGIAYRPATSGEGRGPFLPLVESEIDGFERRLLVASRGERHDWVARFVLPIVEESATERLLESAVKPQWLMQAAVLLPLLAAFFITRRLDMVAALLLLVALPLDVIATRMALLRQRPLPPSLMARRLLWPATALLILSVGWIERHHVGAIAALVTSLAAIAFGEALRIERRGIALAGEAWLFSRRPALLLAVPFAFLGHWMAYLLLLAGYAATSFFVVQQAAHRDRI